ncbi:DUF3455 domain-containing protein [Streptomyces sp. NBC_00829]|uniref:DUF3455 domain-containing protein n=1 Tax=Streptomyces sp. NBC_00829 TaxID=2903679 RepID=UPI00386D1BC9|nr:DUF3455 domain-containing protein [Streptomyces sp. NBC_00829]
MSRKQTASRRKKIAWLVAGTGIVAGGFAVTTGLGFASQSDGQPDASQSDGQPDASQDAGGNTFRAAVTSGVQIYACKQQADGTFAFAQRGVRATLEGGIEHSFVNPDAGPPQWVARDGSAVTGKVVTKTPRGANDIPELELAATQSGQSSGDLANVVTVRRLNTSGGVAPTGSCEPADTVEVPYQADYEFISRAGDGEEASPSDPGQPDQPPADGNQTPGDDNQGQGDSNADDNQGDADNNQGQGDDNQGQGDSNADDNQGQGDSNADNNQGDADNNQGQGDDNQGQGDSNADDNQGDADNNQPPADSDQSRGGYR